MAVGVLFHGTPMLTDPIHHPNNTPGRPLIKTAGMPDSCCCISCCIPCPPSTLNLTVTGATGECGDCDPSLSGATCEMSGGCQGSNDEVQHWGCSTIICNEVQLQFVLNCTSVEVGGDGKYHMTIECNAGVVFGNSVCVLVSCDPFMVLFTTTIVDGPPPAGTPPCCVGTISGMVTE